MAGTLSATNSAHFDANQTPTIMGVIGTLGTADVQGTAAPLPYAVDPSTGAMYVNILAGAGAASNPTSGTLNTLGTVGTILGIGGTVQVSGASAGTNINIVTGTQQTLGTVGVLNTGSIAVTAGTVGGTFLEVYGSASAAGSDVITSMDVSNYRWVSIQTFNTFVGTMQLQVSNDNTNFIAQALNNINTSSGAPTISNIGVTNTVYHGPVAYRYARLRVSSYTSGTLSAAMELYSLPTGFSNIANSNTSLVVASGTLTALAVGTIGGKAASGAVAVANPVQIAGTDGGGTIYAPLVSTAGALTTNLTSSGTLLNLAAGTITALAAGTITAGTLTNLVSGTVNALAAGTITAGTLTNLVSGTINALAAGTITTGTVSVTTGTIVGKEVSAATKVGNGLLIAGTDSGGTIYHPLITSGGAVTVTGASAGTFVNISTGTQQTLGTVGVVNNLVTGTLAALTAVTTVSNLTNGSVNILTGTLQSSGTTTGVGVVTALTTGSVTMTVGTVTTGSLTNLALINAGTLTALGIGTIIKSIPAFQAGSFTAAGTINFAGSQYDSVGIDIGGTYVGTGFFEGQIGTSAFFAIPAITQNGGVVGTQTTTNGDWTIDTTGLSNARFRLTYSSGTLTYNAQQSAFESASQSLLGGSLTNIGSIGNLGMLNAGTMVQASGTTTLVSTVTTVSNLTNGTVNVNTGTINVGTFVYPSGTVTAIVAGTQNTLGTVGVVNNLVTGTLAALTTVTTVSNLTNGSVNLLTGTVTSVTNLAGGTVQLNRIPTFTQATFGTHGTTGVSVFGTLVGGTNSGAGTEIFVTGISLTIPATGGSQDVSIGFGTGGGTFHSGTGRLLRGMFSAGGGIEKVFDPPINSGTNAQLAYFQAGAGTVEVDVTYFITPSTL